MLPFFVVTAAALVAGMLFVLLFGRYAERGARLEQADRTVEVLQEQLRTLTEQQHRLTERIQNLEAIVTTETWDALSEPQREALTSPPEPAEPSPEEKAALLARQRLR